MKRIKWREIKAAYREIHNLDRVSDDTVQDAYVGEFACNRDFEAYINDQCDAIDALASDRNDFDAHGNWTLQYSDMALGVYVRDGHYFKRDA